MMDLGLEGMRVCTFEMDLYCNGKNRYQNIFIDYLYIYTSIRINVREDIYIYIH